MVFLEGPAELSAVLADVGYFSLIQVKEISKNKGLKIKKQGLNNPLTFTFASHKFFIFYNLSDIFNIHEQYIRQQSRIEG